MKGEGGGLEPQSRNVRDTRVSIDPAVIDIVSLVPFAFDRFSGPVLPKDCLRYPDCLIGVLWF